MRTLTKDEAIRLHREMWRWIAEETEKQGRKVEKREYFKTMGVAEDDEPYLGCYCCEFLSQWQRHNYCKKSCAELCPLDWGVGYETGYIKTDCADVVYALDEEAGYFRKWYIEQNPKVAAFLARTIAELPEK